MLVNRINTVRMIAVRSGFLTLVGALLIARVSLADGDVEQPVVPRTYSHALLEPVGNKVLHGVGQQYYQDYTNYSSVLPATLPAVFMPWTSIRSDLGSFMATMKTQLEALNSLSIIPQIGLEFSGDSAAVVAGTYDQSLNELCAGLQALGRPAILRVGIEPNADGLWDSYPPADYVAAFQHITNMVRSYPLPQVATLWQFTPAGSANFMQWYPGDNYVDWWGISIYALPDLSTGSVTTNFMNTSRAHQKPVMIAESTPANVGVLNGQASWDAWFVGYFNFIRTNANIKAFCYINWDWRTTTQWPAFGDAQIEDNPVVSANYQQEMLDPLYLHLNDSTSTLVALGLAPTPPPAVPTTVGAGSSFTLRVYPNPWRADADSGEHYVTFDQWPGANVTIKIFTVSGHLVKTLSSTSTSVSWDLTNNSGQRVASGIYLYLVMNDQGQKTEGKLAVFY